MPTKLWHTIIMIMQYVTKYELNLFTLEQAFKELYFYPFAFFTNLQVLLYLLHLCGLMRLQWYLFMRGIKF